MGTWLGRLNWMSREYILEVVKVSETRRDQVFGRVDKTLGSLTEFHWHSNRAVLRKAHLHRHQCRYHRRMHPYDSFAPTISEHLERSEIRR